MPEWYSPIGCRDFLGSSWSNLRGVGRQVSGFSLEGIESSYPFALFLPLKERGKERD